MTFIPLASMAASAILLSITVADAQDRIRPPARHMTAKRVVMLARAKAPPLTVRKQRSFLDPGNMVEPGADNAYLTSNTTDHVPIYNSFAPARFGESTLPGRFDLPNNPRFDAPNDIDFLP